MIRLILRGGVLVKIANFINAGNVNDKWICAIFWRNSMNVLKIITPTQKYMFNTFWEYSFFFYVIEEIYYWRKINKLWYTHYEFGYVYQLILSNIILIFFLVIKFFLFSKVKIHFKPMCLRVNFCLTKTLTVSSLKVVRFSTFVRRNRKLYDLL